MRASSRATLPGGPAWRGRGSAGIFGPTACPRLAEFRARSPASFPERRKGRAAAPATTKYHKAGKGTGPQQERYGRAAHSLPVRRAVHRGCVPQCPFFRRQVFPYGIRQYTVQRFLALNGVGIQIPRCLLHKRQQAVKAHLQVLQRQSDAAGIDPRRFPLKRGEREGKNSAFRSGKHNGHAPVAPGLQQGFPAVQRVVQLRQSAAFHAVEQSCFPRTGWRVLQPPQAPAVFQFARIGAFVEMMCPEPKAPLFLHGCPQIRPAFPFFESSCHHYTMTPRSLCSKTARAAVLDGSMFSKPCAPAQGVSAHAQPRSGSFEVIIP